MLNECIIISPYRIKQISLRIKRFIPLTLQKIVDIFCIDAVLGHSSISVAYFYTKETVII